MKRPNQNTWENTQASNGEFKRLPAGAYICGIKKVEDVADREYLKLEYDIADGEFKNWWLDTQERAGFWGGSFIRSYKEKALGMFKGFVDAVEKTNEGYKWDWDEQTLKGKFVGLILDYEEYVNNKGECKERIYIKSVVNGRDVRAGKYKDYKPKTKPLSDADKAKLANNSSSDYSADFEEIATSGVPF